MFSVKTYLRATFPKVGLKEGQTIPLISSDIKPQALDQVLYQGLRNSWGMEDYGTMLPVYPLCATFMTHLRHLTDPRFPFQAMGTVHLKTRIDQVRALRIDDRVSYHCFVEGHRPTDRGLEFDMVTQALVNGHLVSTSTMTMLRREAGGKWEHGLKAPQPVHNSVHAQETSWATDIRIPRQYARLTGDINPIHLSQFCARMLGFRGAILHGMWTLGKACSIHPVQMMRENIRVSSEFKLPVYLPATLRYRWWDVEDGMEMRVLDEAGVKPHMIAKWESFK